MNNFQHFISGNGPQVQLLFFMGLFIISWNIENISGVIFNYKKWKHAFKNALSLLQAFPAR